MRWSLSCRNISGVYTTDFPDQPLEYFNFTGDDIPTDIGFTDKATKVTVLNYNESVEIIFQGTNVIGGAANHPMHLHGYSFFVVGTGFWNFNNETDPKEFNLVDPPEVNTIGVPRNGWVAIRFLANNPGMFYLFGYYIIIIIILMLLYKIRLLETCNIVHGLEIYQDLVPTHLPCANHHTYKKINKP